MAPLPSTLHRPGAGRTAPLNESAWGEWMVAAQGGQGGAYRRLLGELRLWLLRYYARRLPPAYVDDAVQEALIAIHEKRHTYDPARPFRPWLAAVARHKWIDRLRSMGREPRVVPPDDLALPGHDEALASAELLGRLLARLKPAQADVIRLTRLGGFSIEETAAQTGQSVPLVKVNIHRGLARLAAMVRDGDDDE
jgi:RNA polymerase sigma-70 factor (ECF subfamily)